MQNLYNKIPDGANAVIDKLYENGHSAFVVGGCVRDFILEKEPHDWDICTDALPKQVMQIFGEKTCESFAQFDFLHIWVHYRQTYQNGCGYQCA